MSYAHNNQKFWHSLRPLFFFFRASHKRIQILMDPHPYSYETSIVTLAAPHEKVQDRHTKLYSGFTLGQWVN